jgi:hypothetical protein
MAREEAEREDLLREATALVERIELTLHDVANKGSENVIIGFRAGGAVSFFFGTEPVYQFNANGELRRAYSAGLLYKAVRGRLVALKRVRHSGEAQLQRLELNDVEQGTFLRQVEKRLGGLTSALTYGRYEIVGQVPSDADVLGRVKSWLAAQTSYRIASAPNV